MNSRNILEGRITGIFGIFMIFIYAGLGIGMLFFWKEVNNHTLVGILLLAWTFFRIYMLFRHRAARKAEDSKVSE